MQEETTRPEPSAPPPRPVTWLQRTLVALVAGACVTAATVATVWVELRHQLLDHRLQHQASVVREFERRHGALPNDLSEAGISHSDRADPWGRPYHYSATEAGFRLMSLGRDGDPGGEGWDRDYDQTNVMVVTGRRSLLEFVQSPPYPHLLRGCLETGALAFLAAMVLVRRSVFAIGALLATCIGAVLVAGAMSQLHVPSGH